MKYVVFQIDLPTFHKHTFVIFPDELVHLLVAEQLEGMKMGTEARWYRPHAVSAGFIQYNINRHLWWTSGKSESMGLRPHPDDDVIINTFDYLHGIGFEKRERRNKPKG